MKQELLTQTRIVKPGEYEARKDAIDIFITDFKIHAQKATNSQSLIRCRDKQVKSGKARRAFSNEIRVLDNGAIETSFNFNQEEILAYLRKTGKRMFRIYMPTAGVPVHLAQDAIEKIKSLERQLLYN